MDLNECVFLLFYFYFYYGTTLSAQLDEILEFRCEIENTLATSRLTFFSIYKSTIKKKKVEEEEEITTNSYFTPNGEHLFKLEH